MKESVIVLSNKSLADQLGLPARLIPVVDLSIALADKLAAWNERRLPRDLYDVYFFLRMGVRPDLERLQARLRKPQYSRLVKAADHFTGTSTDTYFPFLRERVQQLTDDDLIQPLADVLPSDELAGLAWRIRAELVKL